ncbi:hypothetical protein FZI91_16880 [Mycobacterium sp. CBMA271]|uniref:hypothetical protein n=1 Tax=unclassified Mycobacteroides TaxID=2618759 RepID=UPI0012DF84D6|nr:MULTISPECIES: hypothetical protein [unclassified Mycobacteroides]MUM17124.1 hypothetical protein [Mycobacteroides sp. CBMA 326]MUM23363.1 hypothetical protein [Mycobacteroides sp. CBMA 271]
MPAVTSAGSGGERVKLDPEAMKHAASQVAGLAERLMPASSHGTEGSGPERSITAVTAVADSANQVLKVCATFLHEVSGYLNSTADAFINTETRSAAAITAAAPDRS